LDALQGTAAGVRFSFDRFALLGSLNDLQRLLTKAMELGYYVLLEGPQTLSLWMAEEACAVILGQDSKYPCHGMILSPWAGSDCIKPFLDACKDGGKSLFYAVRTANKTAPEVQDLMTGGRLTHVAAADIVNRHGEPIFGKCGYSHIGALTAATNAGAVSGLRAKYKRMFLLVDGIDYPGGNAKNCSLAFDKLGRGAAVCAGPDVTAAWLKAETDGTEYADLAVKAVERLKGNIARYVSIL
jgi:orotidine-5'-phosphate decarboxylase